MSDKDNTVEEAKAIEALVKIISDLQENLPESEKASKGSCRFRAAGVFSCLNMTKSECDLFGGQWDRNGKCSPNPKPGECKAPR